MLPQDMFEHENGGIALLEIYLFQKKNVFELSEEMVFFGGKRGTNVFLEEIFVFELSEQVP